ncbi:MAG: ATPase [Clostridiales bacterium]|jgi:V/A-type H+-transporting ATPase subunit I|nr:ATPase [Clostridiales bacterium]
MIEKMKFVNIMGPKDDIDRVLLKYVTNHEISLEDAIIELGKVKGLKPFAEENPYNKVLETAQELIRIAKAEQDTTTIIDKTNALQIINDIKASIETSTDKKNELFQKRSHYEELKEQVKPFISLEMNLSELFEFQFIKYRFGKLPRDSYKKFEEYIKENADAFFIPCDMDSNNVWGIYFVPDSLRVKNDAIFSSLHFERIILSHEYKGTPLEAYHSLEQGIKEIDSLITQIDDETTAQVKSRKEDIENAYATLRQLNECFKLRKLAVCTKNDFYILTGWTTDETVSQLVSEMENDDNVELVIEDEHSGLNSTPPTKLRNFFLFKPFEMFVKMYGLPSYNEIDPTFFVAVTYAILFGVMFGDVGQGALLVIGGLLIYKFKKNQLAAIMSLSGIFSVIFGFAYGSIFGFEEVLEPLWLSPMHEVNSILIIPCIYGAAIILLSMMFNVINAIRTKDISRMILDKNGVAGIIFYGSALAIGALVIFKKNGIAVTIFGVLVVIGLVLMILKEPLTRLIKKKKQLIKGSKVMFCVETFFEMFEVLLSYVTNTVSFVRVGAFALSHAGMMGVVHLLADTASGNPNIVVLIFGNLLVMGMEGLIVGIQVLRLEFYEIFSRFYTGGGREFKPFSKNV